MLQISGPPAIFMTNKEVANLPIGPKNGPIRNLGIISYTRCMKKLPAHVFKAPFWGPF